MPVVDKTWLFNPAGKLSGWVRARRVGDSADGRSELFRMTADSRILLLGPDLSVQAMRRMVWPEGSIADAVFLWDDLRLGLFILDHHLVLAGWNTPN